MSSEEFRRHHDEQINNTRVYNPYGSLENASGLQSFRSLYEIPTLPQFLFEEEARKRRRSLSENLTYGTGWGYLTGAVGGGIFGTAAALKAVEKGDTAKLVINRILNTGGSSGRKFGNTLGVMGLMFSVIESSIYKARGEVDDVWNYVAAGLATGVIYKAAAGPRSAAVAGGLGALLAGAAVVGKNVAKRYVPI